MAVKISKANPILHLFSGEDGEMIKQLDHPKINRNFNFIGFAVMFICILCFVSAVIFSFNILSGIGKIGSVPIGIFWGFAVTTIYLLLLYTISPPLLVDKKMFNKKNKGVEKSKKKFLFESENLKNFSDWLTLSMSLRIIFIGLFAIITVQPFNVMLFTSLIQNDLDLYKSHYKSEIILETDQSKIEQEINLLEDYLRTVHINALPKEDYTEISKNINPIIEKVQYDKSFLEKSKNLKGIIIDKKVKRSKKDDFIVELNSEIQNEIASDEEFLSKSAEIEIYSKYEFNVFKKNFNKIIEDKVTNNKYVYNLIDNNSFYLRRIIVINTLVPAAFFLNVFSLILFLFPIYLKFQIRKIKPKTNAQSFYYFKKEKELNFVNLNYQTFKTNFERKFAQRQHRSFVRIKENLELSMVKLRAYKPEVAHKIEKELIAKFFPYVDISEHEIYRKYGFSSGELSELKKINRIVFYEKYLDPPFNLKPVKNTIVEFSGQKLINDVWRDE